MVAEAVTLAHVARPVALARGLSELGYTPILAVDPRFASICPTSRWQTETIHSIPSAQFHAALANGSPIYDRATLESYVADDLVLLKRTRPRAVIGDFRLSLSISARKLGIPYINLTNAYWSPFARRQWHAPALGWTRYLSPRLSDFVFRCARPFAFLLHARAMEECRRAHRLPSLGHDLLRIYTDGDITLYADWPELVPTFDAPDTHRHIGPISWSPDLPMPTWWRQANTERGLIYVTLGSSGDSARLSGVIEGLMQSQLPIVVATAGGQVPPNLPAGVHLAAYLPGDLMARHSKLVVCNGGSPTSHQALLHGVPVLSLPTNLDQFLNSAYLKAAGVGAWLRPETATPAAINSAAKALLEDPAVGARAASVAHIAARYDAPALLVAAIRSADKVSARLVRH